MLLTQATVREARTVTLTNSKTALRKTDPEAAVRVPRTEKQLYVQTDRLIIG